LGSIAITSPPLGVEDILWQAADTLHDSMDDAVYKHIVMAPLFLKYNSITFEETSRGENN